MNVNLVGAVGGRNFGDELILNCCIDEYKSVNGISISVSGFDKNLIILKEKNIENKEINFFDIMDELIKIKDSTNYINLLDVKLIFERYNDIDIIHFIGGGYINCLWPTNYALLAIAYVYSKVKEIPIYATGLGLYPHVEDDKLISLFNSLDLVDVRDVESNKFLPRSSFTGDDALLTYNRQDKIIEKNDKPALIISLQNHLFNGKKIIDSIFNKYLYQRLKERKINKIIIIEAAPEDNIEFSRESYNEALDQGIEILFIPSYKLLQTGLPYNSDSFVISSRYHINLIYSMVNIPGVSVYQNEYYRNKHQSIIDMGGNWDVISIENVQYILDKWLKNDYYSKEEYKGMELLSRKKIQLFSEIVNNAPSKKTENLSLDSALEIINKYII